MMSEYPINNGLVYDQDYSQWAAEGLQVSGDYVYPGKHLNSLTVQALRKMALCLMPTRLRLSPSSDCA